MNIVVLRGSSWLCLISWKTLSRRFYLSYKNASPFPMFIDVGGEHEPEVPVSTEHPGWRNPDSKFL